MKNCLYDKPNPDKPGCNKVEIPIYRGTKKISCPSTIFRTYGVNKGAKNAKNFSCFSKKFYLPHTRCGTVPHWGCEN
jgi:hypothetical protein